MCYKCRLIELSVNLDDLEPELRRVARLIYDGKLEPGQIDAAMTKLIAEQLMQGIFKGYGKSLSSADLTPAERTFLTHVQENVYVFSGFKNYQELKEASLLLIDGDGYKSFNSFLNDIKQIDETYNELYLAAEHSNAIASAQSAATWQDYVNNGVDMLMFQTANDDRVRDDHAILNGTIVPIGDPLLDKYFTPLDWGCRCEWIPAPGEEPTGYTQSSLPSVPTMFQNNVGKTGIVFPDTHPYFNVPKNIGDKILEQVANIPKGASTTNDQDFGQFVPPNINEYEASAGVTVDKQIFTLLTKDTPLSKLQKGAFYNPAKNRVNIAIDRRLKSSKWHAEAVVYHEYGHAADWQLGLKKLPAVKDLMSKYRGKYRDRYVEIHNSLTKELRDAYDKKDEDLKNELTATADALMSLNTAYGWGHTKSYFKIAGMKEAEFIAHAFENKFIGNSVFKRLMPELYDDTINLVDEFFKLK